MMCRSMTLADKDARLADAGRKELAHVYAEKALALLRRAVAGGFKDVARLNKDPELEPLRTRNELRRAIADLEEKSSESFRP
jgi:hypothetical protein